MYTKRKKAKQARKHRVLCLKYFTVKVSNMTDIILRRKPLRCARENQQKQTFISKFIEIRFSPRVFVLIKLGQVFSA